MKKTKNKIEVIKKIKEDYISKIKQLNTTKTLLLKEFEKQLKIKKVEAIKKELTSNN